MTEWGKLRCDTTYALYQWVIYLLLGKLSSGFYLLENRKTGYDPSGRAVGVPPIESWRTTDQRRVKKPAKSACAKNIA